MHAFVQQTVDLLIVIMAVLLALFTAALLVLHFITNATQKSMQRIREQVLRVISADAQIAYLKDRVYRALENGGATLRGIRGIRTPRGVQVLEIISREATPAQAAALRASVEEPWYAAFLRGRMAGHSKETALLAAKLAAQLRLDGYTPLLEQMLRRWGSDPDAQQICLLAWFLRGDEEELVRLFSDRNFPLKLSFRTLQELFRCYGGGREALYRRLLSCAADPYVRRACIRGIGLDGCMALSGAVQPALLSDNQNLVLEAVRTLGALHCRPALDTVRRLSGSDSFAIRCAAVDALARLDLQGSRDVLLRCLSDREWWVRFHAAEALMQLPDRAAVVDEVRAGGDRFAGDMLRYMIEREALLKGETVA